MSFIRSAISSIFTRHLFVVNTTVSSSLQGIGDVIQQNMEGKWKKGADDHKHNWHRTCRMMAIGFVLGGISHNWYRFLDKRFIEKTKKTLLRKVVLDQTIAAPIMAFTFVAGLSTLEGNKPKAAFAEFRMKFPTIYAADCCVWPTAQYVNFCFLPPHLRAVFVSSMDFIWYRFSSYVKHD